MRLYLLAAALIAFDAAQAQAADNPSRIQILGYFFSDYLPASHYRMLEAEADGDSTIIRYSKLSNASDLCWRPVVRTVEARTSVRLAKLLGSSNPCRINAQRFKTLLVPPPVLTGGFERLAFAILSYCGASRVELLLPDEASVDFKRLKSTNPEMAGLWTLMHKLVDRSFHVGDPFANLTEAADMALQRAGIATAADLTAGKYDDALAILEQSDAAERPSFQPRMKKYFGPISSEQVKSLVRPRLQNTERFRFRRFVVPDYPPLAAQARIQGKVDLEIDADPASGEVLEVRGVAGHPLLLPTSIATAKQWRFEPDSLDSKTVSLTIEYSLTCRE